VYISYNMYIYNYINAYITIYVYYMLTIHVYWLMSHKVFFMPMTSRHRLVHGSFRLNFYKRIISFSTKIEFYYTL